MSESWRVRALQAIRELAEKDYVFSSDDIHRAAGDAPHMNSIGQVFKEAEQLDIIERTGGVTVSKRPEAKQRKIPLWRKKEQAQEEMF